MLQLKIKAGRRHIPIFDLPAALGRKAAYEEIGDQVDALIAFMDDLQGDVDLEDGGDDEPDTDAMGDQSWPEWHTLPAQQRRTGNSRGKALPESWFTPLEDDEDSDPAEDSDSDYCLAGDDRIMGGSVADPDLFRVAHGVGDETDAEDGDMGGTTASFRMSFCDILPNNGPLAPSAGRQAANDR